MHSLVYLLLMISTSAVFSPDPRQKFLRAIVIKGKSV